MSNVNAARPNRPNRDKSGKNMPQNTKERKDNQTSTAQKNQMNKPVADLHQMAGLTNRKPDDPDQKRVNQIMELTNKTEEEVIVALHDCDQDTNRTVDLLLEGGGDPGEWQEMGKKRKKAANAAQSAQNKSEQSDGFSRRLNNGRDRSDERDFPDKAESRDRSEFSSRGRKMNSDGPPRFQRAGKPWPGSKENGDANYKNRGERGGNSDRGRGRGRGRGGGRGSGRGATHNGGSFSTPGFGGSGFSSGFEKSEPISDWADSEPKTNGFESSPIDTWTNDQAATEKQKNQWTDGEDWNDDDWSGNLTETTIFTARNPPANAQREEQADFNSGADDGFMQNAIQQPMGLNAMLNQKSNEKIDLHTQTNEATESLKSMMGIGATTQHDYSISTMTTRTDSSAASQSMAVGTASQSVLNQGSVPQSQRSSKPARSKMPPPSKIPNTPVEMPGMSMHGMRLDVQFGFGANNSGFGDADSTMTSQFSNSSMVPMSTLNHSGATTDVSTSTVASLSSMVQHRQNAPALSNIEASPNQHQSIFNSSSDSPSGKDYQQSLNKSLISSPESYGKQERHSPRVQSRNPGTIESDSKYPQSAYPSSYQSRYSHKGPDADKQSYSKPQSQYPSGFQSSNSFHGSSQYSKLGQFQTSTSTSYRGHGSYDPQSDTSSASYQSSQAYAQKQPQQAQSSSYQSGKLAYSQQSSLPAQSSSASTYSGSKSGYGHSDAEFGKPTASSTTPYSSTQTFPSQSSGRQSDESFPGTQAASNTYTADSPSNVTSYQANASSYDSSNAASLSTTAQQPKTSNQSTQYGTRTSYSNHSSGLQTSPISASKLSEGLGKMSVEDGSMTSTSYTESDVSSTTSGLTAQTASVSLSSSSSNQLGLATSTATSTSLTSARTSSSNTTASKAPPNPPPGVPTVMGPNFIMGQPGMQYFGLQSLTQQPVYSYEDLQLLQQRLMPGYAYDPNTALPFPQTPTSLSGARADQSSIVSNVPQPYPAQGTDAKLNRMDAPSPVQASQASQQPNQSAHQQQFINAALAPGYGYYAYPNAGLVPGGPFSYTPTMFQQVPPVTNSAHVQAGTTSSSQFQKPYPTSHPYSGYDDLVQAQDYGKSGSYHLSQGAAKVTNSAGIKPITTSTSDMGNQPYAKTHNQGYDKQGFHHGGTPPPYGIPAGVSSGQANALPQNAYAQFMPMMSHQHSQMMAHTHLHQQVRQDQSGLRPGAQPPSAAKPGTGMSKYGGSGYWNTA